MPSYCHLPAYSDAYVRFWNSNIIIWTKTKNKQTFLKLITNTFDMQ